MATLTLTATPEPDNRPPRVLLEIADTGSPAIASVTISRLDQDGRGKVVRTSDAGALTLSGGTATIYDYEAPYGTDVVYSIAEGNAPSTATRLDVGEPWLIHVGVPSRSVPLDLRVGSNQAEEWPVEQGVFRILGRDHPIVITGGARSAPSSSLIVATDSEDERKALRLALSDATAMLLNVSPSLALGIDTTYVAIGAVRPRRRSDIGTDTSWDFELPYQVVGRPAGGTQAAITWAEVATDYVTWAEVALAVDSWSALAAPTT